jgi:hypothetical protein
MSETHSTRRRVVAATDDAGALIDLRPDCVVYSASGPERDAAAVTDYERLLSAGINVVTTTGRSGPSRSPSTTTTRWRR